jgi:urease accessory protein
MRNADATETAAVEVVIDDDAEKIANVGRVGELTLEYVLQGRQTVLSQSRCSSPWHLIPPISLDDTGCAYTLLLNPSGGLVGGDRLSIHAKLGPKTHALFSTPSANRIYRSMAQPSVQCIDVTVGAGAILEWVPDLAIPYAGSRFRQIIHVALEPGATVLLWDAMASGRVARGERWAFTSLENEIRITTASDGCVLERYHLTPVGGQEGIGLAGEWDYVASFFVVGDAVGSKTWEQLSECLAVILEDCGERLLGGVSEPAAPGLAVKLLARSAPDLNGVLEPIWGAARTQLWDVTLPALRRY